MIDDILEEAWKDPLYNWPAIVAMEMRRQRRRRAIGLAVLCVSFCAVVAVSWWLK